MSDIVTKVIVIIGLFIGVPVVLDLRRRLVLRRKIDRMNLPTEQDINADGSQDSEYALRRWLGKTRDQITKEWAEHGHYYYEDLHYMGPRAFCFYLPAVVDYVTTAGFHDDDDTVSDLCRVIEGRLKNDLPAIRDALPEILRFTDYALAHFEESGHLADDLFGDLRPRLRAIRGKCAEQKRFTE